jgi:hypothetical protein
MTIDCNRTDNELTITLKVSRLTMEEYIQESFRDRNGFKFKDHEQWWHTMGILHEAMEDYWARNFEKGALENILERIEVESEPSDEET